MEICRPAASSLALLIRRPEARRVKEVSRDLLEFAKLRWALSDETLVLMYMDIINSPDESKTADPRAHGD
ncbi:hypothetical protein D3C78_1909210 [compost metagenome]